MIMIWIFCYKMKMKKPDKKKSKDASLNNIVEKKIIINKNDNTNASKDIKVDENFSFDDYIKQQENDDDANLFD